MKKTVASLITLAALIGGSVQAQANSVEQNLLGFIKENRLYAVSDSDCLKAIKAQLAGRKSRGFCFDKYSLILSAEDTERAFKRLQTPVDTISTKDVGPTADYVRVDYFGERTAIDLVAFLKASDAPAIIDVRNNRGGRLEASVTVAAAFATSPDTIIYTERSAKGLVSHTASQILEGQDTIKVGELANKRVVILINGGTVSSAEIFAATLKLAGANVTLVGKSTHGKAMAQKNVTFADEHGDRRLLVYTAFEYLAGTDQKIHGVKVKPDVEERDTRDDETDTATLQDGQFETAAAMIGVKTVEYLASGGDQLVAKQ